ncbi:hypothetical protein BC828DRAFT_387198 [Blastocladiella britannica]|nr:hypothetical protein BC828DRAFT_387198 [Blastocladiella britannica]
MSSPFPAPPSFVTTAEMATYSTQFLALPSAQADFRKRASGQEVRTVLIKSGLPAPVLGQIWSLADMSKCGALTFAEFLLALSLAKHAMANVSVVPAELPVRIQNEVFSLNIQLGFSSSTPSVASVTGPLSAQQTGFTSVSQRPINPASYEVSMAPAMPAIPPGMAAAMMGGGSGLPQSTSLGSLQHLASTSRVNSAGSLGLSAMSVPGIISSLPVGGAVGTTWTITHDERVKYASLFKSWDSASVGYLSGEQCRDIFSTSGLPQNIMQHIWSLADIHNAGKLNSDEFAIAMHLIYKKLNNVDLPTKLPEELIPASHKDLDMSVSFMKDKLMQQMLSEKMAAASAPSWARGGAVSSGAGISATAPGSGEVAGTGYVSKHRRRGAGGDPSSTQTPPTDPVAKERAVDLQRQIDQARELLTLKREQAQRLRIAQGKLEDPARVRELHGQIAELQKVLRALKAQFDDRLRSGVAISSTDSASAGALRPIVDQILESKRKFNEVQLKLFKLRDLKKYKYPPIPEKTAINLSSLLGSSSGSTSTIVSEDERRRQKAAEMLAQRMAALNMGPSSTAPTPAALTPAQTEAMARIDAEKARLDAALRELEGKLKSVVDPAAAQALLAEFQVQVKLLDDLLRPVQLPSEYAESATTPAAPEPVRDREAFDALRERLRKVTEASTLPPPPPPQQREQQNSQLISDSQRYTAGNPFGAAAAAVAMSQPSAPSPFASPFEQQAARPSAASPPAPAKDDVTHKSISDRAAALSSIFPGVIAPPHDQKSTVSPPDAAQRRMSTDWLSSGSAVATATDTFAADPFAPPPPPVPSGLGQFAAPTALPPIKVAQAAAATPPKPRSPSPVKAAATPSSPRVFDNPFAVPASQAAPSPSPSSSPFNPFGEPTSPFAEPTPAPADPFAAAAAAAPSPFASAAPSPSVLYMATAQYAYEATNAEEMDLAEFDRIEVLEVDDEWGRGRKAGSTIEGWFPMSYIKQGAQKESAAADTAASARGMMLYDYTATASDELTVNADVHVDILDDATDPDWWLVGVNGERGLVPANYVERM